MQKSNAAKLLAGGIASGYYSEKENLLYFYNQLPLHALTECCPSREAAWCRMAQLDLIDAEMLDYRSKEVAYNKGFQIICMTRLAILSFKPRTPMDERCIWVSIFDSKSKNERRNFMETLLQDSMRIETAE